MFAPVPLSRSRLAAESSLAGFINKICRLLNWLRPLSSEGVILTVAERTGEKIARTQVRQVRTSVRSARLILQQLREVSDGRRMADTRTILTHLSIIVVVECEHAQPTMGDEDEHHYRCD